MSNTTEFAAIDLDAIEVSEDLSEILVKDSATPTFNGVLSKYRKQAAGLRKTAWPAANAEASASEEVDSTTE